MKYVIIARPPLLRYTPRMGNRYTCIHIAYVKPSDASAPSPSSVPLFLLSQQPFIRFSSFHSASLFVNATTVCLLSSSLCVRIEHDATDIAAHSRSDDALLRNMFHLLFSSCAIFLFCFCFCFLFTYEFIVFSYHRHRHDI